MITNSKIQNEFSINAASYGKYNIIQNKVVNELIANIFHKPQTILDLGCGQGAIYKAINWPVKEFIGIDNSDKMLKLHDNNNNVRSFK